MNCFGYSTSSNEENPLLINSVQGTGYGKSYCTRLSESNLAISWIGLKFYVQRNFKKNFSYSQ